MGEWRDEQVRYLVRFDDGGAGMRSFAKPIMVGDEIADAGETYVIVSIEPAPLRAGLRTRPSGTVARS